MIFTQKKFRLIGARARIKKVFHMLEDLIPVFQTPADIELFPTYLDYLITLNQEARKFRFSDAESRQLQHYRAELAQWQTADPERRRQPFSFQDRRHVAKVLMELRYLLADKIQQPLKEGAFVVLERDVPPPQPLIWPREIVVVLDHLRSPYNVGAIIRTMECVSLRRVLSIGYTPRLDSRQVQRSAMGCEAWMNVEYVQDGVTALKALQEQGFHVHILETIIPATSIFDLDPIVAQGHPIALVIGNEEFGVDESIIAIADHVLRIPTFGKKNSLNVSIAFSIAIYQFWAALLGE
ncbi:hypothetical protein GF339_03215 [candidate division KSB3 bacterium]|uniref:tRNA/rRNA methyltransferase SpoU type domain-containing protein n=1 Tax=candidate division KSB3 bacterium TaxID=2044937 RepID=A0A9D5Q553_9BACT|nr:hypothetical protein [candidate division KSB3 bacterium]MBD3323566.1 hypothetical protein [candidate division KSB3 bacterium]